MVYNINAYLRSINNKIILENDRMWSDMMSDC